MQQNHSDVDRAVNNRHDVNSDSCMFPALELMNVAQLKQIDGLQNWTLVQKKMIRKTSWVTSDSSGGKPDPNQILSSNFCTQTSKQQKLQGSIHEDDAR